MSVPKQHVILRVFSPCFLSNAGGFEMVTDASVELPMSLWTRIGVSNSTVRRRQIHRTHFFSLACSSKHMTSSRTLNSSSISLLTSGEFQLSFYER